MQDSFNINYFQITFESFSKTKSAKYFWLSNVQFDLGPDLSVYQKFIEEKVFGVLDHMIYMLYTNNISCEADDGIEGEDSRQHPCNADDQYCSKFFNF